MKRGRKPKSQAVQTQRTEFIELGTSRSRNLPVTAGNRPVSDSLLVSVEGRKVIERAFNKSEEIVGTILDLWFNTEDVDTRNQLVSDKICLALNYMYLKPLDPDGYIYSSIAYLSQLVPELFALPEVLKNSCRMLQKEPRIDDAAEEQPNFQNPFRRNPSIPLLSCATLYVSHKDLDSWPLSFIQCYMEDAFNTRAWADAEPVRLFVLNILTCLPPPRRLGKNGNIATAAKIAAGISENTNITPNDDNLIRNRWPESERGKIELFIQQMVQFHEPKRNENITNFIRTMFTVACIPSTRKLGAPYIAEWLAHLGVLRYGKEYLRRVALETCTNSPDDLKTLDIIINMKVKPQQFNIYYESVQLLLANNPSYPVIALKTFVQNEFKNSQPNFRLMGLICKAIPDKSETHLAHIFQEMAGIKEHQLPFQQFFRRLLKAPARDGIQFDIIQFASDLLHPMVDINAIVNRELWFSHVIDIVCLSCLLCVPVPFDTKAPDSLQKQQDFQMKVSTLQRHGIMFCHAIVAQYIGGSPIIFQFVRKIVFCSPPDSYSFLQDPAELNLFTHLQNDIPVHEATAIRVVMLGQDPKIHVSPENALELLCQLYYRAASLQKRDSSIQVMNVENPSIVGNILQLASVLPPGEPVIWVANDFYWKACILLLIIAAYNPKVVGDMIWKSQPTIRQMMEMCVMQRYVNAPVEREIPAAMEMRSKKLQAYHHLQQQERDKLAMVSSNSPASRQLFEWLNNGCVMLDPKDLICDLPRPILKQIEMAASKFGLGKVLCSSRSPDFLVDIMQRQGAKHAIGWLLPIIKDDPAALSNLPVSALIHLLFAYIDREIGNKHPEDFLLLLREFRKYFDDISDPQPTQDVITLLFSDVATMSSRSKVKKAASLIFNHSITRIIMPKEEKSPTQLKLPQSTRRTQMFSSPSMRSPSSRNSPVDNLRVSTGSIPSLNAEQIAELQKTLKEPCSFYWLESLCRLKHFTESQNHIFGVLRDVLLLEDVEEDFYTLLTFLTEVANTEPIHKYQLACTLGSVLCGRRITTERLFQSARVYQRSLELLWDAFEASENSTSSEADHLPPSNILAQVSTKTSTVIIAESILRGLVNLLCLSCRFPKSLSPLPNSEGDITQLNIKVATKIFGDSSGPLYKRDIKENDFVRLLSSDNAFDLICSSESVLFTPGAYYFPKEELFYLLKRFGISLQCMECIILRLLKEFTPEELFSNFQSLPASVSSCIGQRLSMYASMGVTIGNELFQRLELSLEDTESEDEGAISFSDSMDMEIDITSSSTDSFAFLRTMTPSAVKSLLNEYFHKNTSTTRQDQIRDSLLLVSTSTINDDLVQLNLILKVIREQLMTFLQDKSMSERLFHIPSVLIIKLLDSMRVCEHNLKNKENLALLDDLHDLFEEKLNQYRAEHKKPVQTLLLNYVTSGRKTKMLENAMEDSISISDIKRRVDELVGSNTFSNDLEEFLSKLVLSEPKKLFVALVDVINASFGNNNQSMGILLDAIETCYDVTDNENKSYLFTSIFSPSGMSHQKSNYSLVLLSMILHHGSWSDMHQFCNWIFTPPQSKTSLLDYKNAMEFMRAFVFHPRSWSGYTTNEESTIIQQVPSLYQFTPKKLISLVDFILAEQQNANNLNSLPDRMNFLRLALQQNTDNLHSVLLYILSRTNLSPVEQQALQQIRGLLYLSFPHQIHGTSLLSDSELFQNATKESQLDLTFHRLLRSLLDANLCEIAYQLLSNLVILHKKIFLRYLPIMTALLQGRTHLTPTAFVEKQFYRLYMHCLGILDLLRPEVFVCDELNDLLLCYFPLLENWCSSYHENLSPLIEKFINFLCYYSLEYCEMIEAYQQVLEQIKEKYPHIRKVSLLLDMISTKGKEQRITSGVLKHIPWNKERLNDMKRCVMMWNAMHLTINMSEDQIINESGQCLEELHRTASQSPGVIEFFVSELTQVIRSPHSSLRGLAYALLLQYLNYSPASSSIIIPGYLKCFSHSDDVLNDALERAHHFFFFAQGASRSFLQSLFDVGVIAAPAFKAILSTTTIFK